MPLEPNGVIAEYQVQCSGGGQMFSVTVPGSQTTAILTELVPYTNYSCSITAYTSAGGGPAATISINTEQDGIYATKHSLSMISPYYRYYTV